MTRSSARLTSSSWPTSVSHGLDVILFNVGGVGRKRQRIRAELLCRRLGLGIGVLPEPISPSLLRLFQQDIRLDATHAQQSLQLQWTTLADGLARSARALASLPRLG